MSLLTQPVTDSAVDAALCRWGLMFAPEYLPTNGVLNPGRMWAGV